MTTSARTTARPAPSPGSVSPTPAGPPACCRTRRSPRFATRSTGLPRRSARRRSARPPTPTRRCWARPVMESLRDRGARARQDLPENGRPIPTATMRAPPCVALRRPGRLGTGVLAVLGGSIALVDHLVGTRPLALRGRRRAGTPARGLRDELVAAVGPAERGSDTAYDALRIAYRRELLGIAALDLTSPDPVAYMPTAGGGAGRACRGGPGGRADHRAGGVRRGATDGSARRHRHGQDRRRRAELRHRRRRHLRRRARRGGRRGSRARASPPPWRRA